MARGTNRLGVENLPKDFDDPDGHQGGRTGAFIVCGIVCLNATSSAATSGILRADRLDELPPQPQGCG